VAEQQIHALSDPHIVSRSKSEIKILWRRVQVINWAIGLCVAAGLMVCSVIMALFSGSLWVVDLKTLIIALFMLAMLFLISALVVFLVEVKLATNTIKLVRTIR
jgi:hypothetical protein